MAGISSKALNGGAENKFKYGGKELQSNEFTDHVGLELYDFHARIQDPQIGRFWQLDPKCETLYHINPYNYCFNNPLIFVDPDGMLAVYNWKDGKYYDEGKEVSWDKVQQQHLIGEYSTTKTVMITQHYNDDSKSSLKEDGNGALQNILNAALNAPGGHIKVVQANDAMDAADQIEKISGKIENLFIASHGTTHKRQKAFFSIGSDTFHWYDITENEYFTLI